MTQASTSKEVLLITEILQRISADLSMITDQELVIEPSEVVRSKQRPAGAGQVHISFRFGVFKGTDEGHGCLLMPLPEAISLAGYLMMLSEQEVNRNRELDAPDEPTKEAILEVGNFIAGATDAALRETLAKGHKVRPEGCQGVRADVRPVMIYEEGSPLIVGHAKASLQGSDEFDLAIVLPKMSGL